jgi:hypothetical protein
MLLLIFILVLCSIVLIRMALNVFLLFARNKYAKLVEYKKNHFNSAKKHFNKEDSELLRAKDRHSKMSVQKMASPGIAEDEAELNEVKIVYIVKPVGFWTSVILGQKLTYLVSSAQIMNKNSRKGFWVSMIEAQERAQGRQKGRSL